MLIQLSHFTMRTAHCALLLMCDLRDIHNGVICAACGASCAVHAQCRSSRVLTAVHDIGASNELLDVLGNLATSDVRTSLLSRNRRPSASLSAPARRLIERKSRHARQQRPRRSAPRRASPRRRSAPRKARPRQPRPSRRRPWQLRSAPKR
jgi:hypothetical protein